ncbi:MAG: phosphotransferase [bacterium]
MSELLLNFVTNSIGPKANPKNIEIKKLFGQASYREYFRASLTDNGQRTTKTYIIMQMPSGFSSPAEEITKIQEGAPTELPFINVNTYLASLELPVPQIIATNIDKGLILLEDLGDNSLEIAYRKAGPEFGLVYYKKAIDLLVHLQAKTHENKSSHCIAYYRSFDQEMLNWEFNHFLEYGVEDRLSCTVSDTVKQNYKKITATLSQTINIMPQGFTHRDYQSRNLMLYNYDFYLIDYQDALVAPVLYDLVALLRDSYICFSTDTKKALLNYYLEKLPSTHAYYQEKEKLYHDFHLLTIQRKLKDAGRFQFIHTVKNNSGFLQNIPQSFAYVKEALELCAQNEQAALLHQWLRENVEEFK